MKRKFYGKNIFRRILAILIGSACITGLYAQEITDTVRKPAQFVVDSLEKRQQFTRDSILVRERFVRDSLEHRQRMLDSLTMLQNELPGLLNAYFRTVKEDIMLRSDKVAIIGDSVLGDYKYLLLPFSTTQPYTPWKVSLALGDNSVKISVDKKSQKITSIQAPFMSCSFVYGDHDNVLVINERSIIQNHWSEQFYKTPFDSVFFDRYKRVAKIKRYIQFYSVINKNQQGAPLFLYLSQVMQYEYGPDNQISQYQVVKFCERWKVYDPGKVCSIITYSLTKKDNTYLLTRHNDPVNNYSDGIFTYVFDDNDNLNSLAFHNLSNTEHWQRIIELNKDGNVSCYFDKTNDIVRQSLCMIYHLHEPNTKYPVETITTIFEENGISYSQKNNTTGLSRTRDKMTLEWSPWK
jgi:hypothetical protein